MPWRAFSAFITASLMPSDLVGMGLRRAQLSDAPDVRGLNASVNGLPPSHGGPGLLAFMHRRLWPRVASWLHGSVPHVDGDRSGAAVEMAPCRLGFEQNMRGLLAVFSALSLILTHNAQAQPATVDPESIAPLPIKFDMEMPAPDVPPEMARFYSA